MNIDKKAVGKRIKNIRLMLGYTMAEFGGIMGNANTSLVTKWERGAVLPKADRLTILADISGLDEESLLYGIKPYELPDHIQQKILDPSINQFLEIKEYETYLALSGNENSIAAHHTFQEIQRIAKLYEDKKKADYLYGLEQKEQVKTNKPQPKIDYDLKDILSSSYVIGFDNKALTEEQKQLILNMLNPLVQYLN